MNFLVFANAAELMGFINLIFIDSNIENFVANKPKIHKEDRSCKHENYVE